MVQRALQNSTVCVVGLGYVGYPLADAFSRHVTTIGYDLDTKKIARINAEPGNRVLATTDPARISEADVVIIAVPTPVTKAKDPDISYVVSAAETVGRNLKHGAIVVEKIRGLAEDPFPGGNKEKLEYPHPPVVYRLHIGMSFTVFYIIEHEENVVKIMAIEKAHKEYSRR